MMPSGYRHVLSAEGYDLDKDHYDTYLVDFTDYLTKNGFAKDLTQTVYRVNNNACVHASP